jgi:hypothetical protein
LVSKAIDPDVPVELVERGGVDQLIPPEPPPQLPEFDLTVEYVDSHPLDKS